MQPIDVGVGNLEGRRRRVLQVLFSFRVGGSEIFGLRLAKQLADRGVEVICGALDGSVGPLMERCAELDIETVDLGVRWDHFLARNGLSFELIRRLQELHVDAIHLQHFLGLNKLGIAAKLARIPRIIVTEHSVADIDQAGTARMRASVVWRLADKITVVHEGIKDYLCGRLGIPPGKIEVIPIGIETDTFAPGDRTTQRAALGLGAELVFIFVGRLAPVKNVPGLISAYLAVEAAQPKPTRLLVVGDGEDRAECERLVRLHPLGNRVSMLGEVSNPLPLLTASDVFVMNSRSEGTPRALLEAMAVGLAPICPAVGGIPAILGGLGWLTVPGRQSSLEETIGLVARKPDLIRAVGAECRSRIVEHYEAGKIAGRYAGLLGV